MFVICTYVHVCMYVCMHVRTYVHTYVLYVLCMYVHTYVRTYVHTYVCCPSSQDSSSSFPSQLEVTLITARSQSAVQTAVDGSGGQLNVDCLSKIQVICVSSEGDGSDGGDFSEPVGGDGDEDLLGIGE